MDEILLTPEDIEREGWAAFDAWERESQCREMTPDSEAGHSAYRSWCDAWLCRAQLRQVVAWLERETAPHDPNHYWMGARRILRDETLAALREAAGGEEK